MSEKEKYTVEAQFSEVKRRAEIKVWESVGEAENKYRLVGMIYKFDASNWRVCGGEPYKDYNNALSAVRDAIALDKMMQEQVNEINTALGAQ